MITIKITLFYHNKWHNYPFIQLHCFYKFSYYSTHQWRRRQRIQK